MGKTINLDHVTKIEGHARLNIKVVDGNVEKCELKIMEGARFFEGIVKGKKYNELSHITSRICGVCSVVHAIASSEAVENAFGVEISEQSKKLRELLNIGGTIQSHALHLYFLALPDYYGKENALQMLQEHKEIVERALRLKRLGNNIVFTVAGRDVHPIACVVGGFSRVPDKEKVAGLLKELEAVREDAIETVKLFMGLDYPEFEKPASHFALAGGPYFYSHKTMKCESGTCFPSGDYHQHIKEHFREGMTAEFATKEGKSYFVGALPRVINRLDELSDECKVYVKDFREKQNNPFMNIPAQAVEILEGVNRSIEIIEGLEIVDEENSEVNLKPCECEGIAAISAPRGVLFHRYKFDKNGYCLESDITTPTTQNLALMEEAIKAFLLQILDEDEDSIKLKIEKLIRAYDPCISCSAHFLELNLERN